MSNQQLPNLNLSKQRPFNPSNIKNIQDFIEKRAEIANISCKTFIVTVFGDTLSQHGDWIWIGSLIDSLQPLGYSERLVRTSVYRLVKEDWLQVKKIGRKSYYSFTQNANNHYIKAARRIYASCRSLNSNQWLIVFLALVQDSKILALKRQLKWLGFSALSPGVYAHANFEKKSLEETLKELKLTDSVIVFFANTVGQSSNEVLKRLVYEKWDLMRLQKYYQALVEGYQPIFDHIVSHQEITSEQSFLLRSLIIHEYRRILLKDPDLPCNILAADWKGKKATELVKALYLFLAKKSTRYVVNSLRSIDGYLPNENLNFKKRFIRD